MDLPKGPLRSKSYWFNGTAFIGLWLLAKFWPGYERVMCGNKEIILSIVLVVNMILRRFTRTALRFKKQLAPVFALTILTSCAGIPQKLDPNMFYKRDLGLCVKDQLCYEGVTVLPRQSSYEIDVEPKGKANIDLLTATSCHREESFEKTDRGWWIFKSKSRFKYIYTPVPGLEDIADCPLRVNTFEKALGRHAWSLVLFEHPKYQLDAQLTCNGIVRNFHGVSVCQAKAGLLQRIKFSVPVQIITDDGCPMPTKVSGGAYEFAIAKNECGYSIRDEKENYHTLLTVGYEGQLIREMEQ